MIEQRQSLLRVHPRLRQAVYVALCVVLAGYLAFNKPFAQLGYPPLYVGEMILACCVLCALEWASPAVFQPLRRSWTFRLIAVFLIYGLLRGALAYFSHGFLALRDSVVAAYALLAFAAPAVLCRSAPEPENDAVFDMPAALVRMLLPATLAAGFWAACVQFNWFHSAGSETKVDFLTLATATGAWVWTLAALRTCPGHRDAARLEGDSGIACVAAVGLALALALLVRALPTRTVWLSIVPLAFVFGAAFAYTPRRRSVLFAVGALALSAVAVLMLTRAGPLFGKFSAEFGLNENLNFSLDEIEAQLKNSPEKYEKLVLSTVIRNDEKTARERLGSLLDPDADFASAEGRLGGHAVKWRAIFWMRCANYTLANAPLFGVGFGRNLTNLLRSTSAWPMYVDSIRVDPPNRSPHSAHVGIFARLGLVGLALWLAVLGAVFWNGLRACWHHGALAAQSGGGVHRRRFWDTLTILGMWVLVVWTMSFGVILEGPFGGFWFWILSGVLAWNGYAAGTKPLASEARAVNSDFVRVTSAS